VNSEKPIRLQDIALKAGVSRATVSLALRNHPSVSRPVREKIQRLAGQLGYRPNPLVSALMAFHRAAKPVVAASLPLALVIEATHQDPMALYLSPDLIAGATAAAQRHGYRLEQFWREEMTDKRLSQVLFARGILGLIIAPLPVPAGELNLDWSKFSAVAIGETLVRPDLHRVTTNRFRAMRLAIERLRQMGYRRVGLAMRAGWDDRVINQWSAAFLWEQQHDLASQGVPLFIVNDADWTERQFAAWFNQNQPEVILGCEEAIVCWLEKLGRKVPDAIGFAHLWSEYSGGRFAGLNHHPAAHGAAAVDLLVAMIHRNERGVPEMPQVVQLKASWADGPSLRCRR